jgi:hypothetical protein
MKKKSFIFSTFILGLFMLQNVHSEELRTITYDDSSTSRYVLWRIHTQEFSDSTNKQIQVKVDSVLKENFYYKEKWILYSVKVEKTSTGYRTYTEKLNLNQNAYYLVLTNAGCSKEKIVREECVLILTEKDYILPNTPENMTFLNKKWNETKVIYKHSNPRPRIKSRDIDM